MVQTNFNASDSLSLATVLLDISSGTDAAPNTAYTITMTAAIDAASENVSLENGSNVTLEGSFPFIINAFTVTGSIVTDLNFTGTVDLDNGALDNVALAANGGGTIVAGLYTGAVLGTPGDSGDSAVNSGTISYSGTFAAVEFNSGTVQNGWNGPAAALISGAAGGVALFTGGLVQNGGSIISSGTSSAAVFMAAGTVDNGQIGEAGASISGGENGVEITGAGVLANDGTIEGVASDAVYLGSGTVTNGQVGDETALIAGGPADNGVWIGSGLGSVDNFSTITGGGASGVLLTHGGSVTNGAASDTASVITGAVDGVLMAAAGSVLNDGTIDGDGTDAVNKVIGVFLENGGSIGNDDTASVISGEDWGAIVEGAGGTVANVGSIGASGTAGLGIDLTAGGTVVNGLSAGAAATISGVFDGVRISKGTASAGAVVQNDGTISGTVGVDFESGPTPAAGTLTNDGLIESTTGPSGFAVEFGIGSETLVLGSGGAFIGHVLGDNVSGSSTTLELATGTQGTLNGLGNDGGTVTDAAGSFVFSEIGTIQLDTGASWTVNGPGTLDTVADDGALDIAGAVVVNSGDTDANGGIDIGEFAGASGQVMVAGTQSSLSNTGKFVVGDSGVGSLSIESGGTVIATPGTAGGLAGLVIANTAGADGSAVTLIGAGSKLQVTGLLDVGVAGFGGLSISNGASVMAGTLDAANIISAVANINVSGANFTVSGSATVADDGTGVMSVLSGATFSAAELTIGSQGDSSGALVVSGNGSIVNISGDLNVGTALGTGDLTIGPGATVNAQVVNLQGEVVLEDGDLDPTVNLINQGQTAGGSGTIAAGDIVDEGVIQAGGSKPSQKLLVVAGTILGGGPWTINGTAQPQANGDAGILQINAGGTMELTGPVLNAASTTFTDDVTPQSTYTVNDSVVDVNFEDASGVLKIDDIGGFGGTIAAFRKGDSFVISGGTLSNLGVTGGDTLTVSDSGNGGTDSLIFSSGINASGFTIVNSNTIQVACFAAGTRIATESGPVAVEDLRVGDRVITVSGHTTTGSRVGLSRFPAVSEGDNAVTCDASGEPIVWVGKRTANCERHRKPETVWPVRVSAGAFDDNVPVRDLYLSPDHAVFVNGVLVPVKLLINGTSIEQVKRNIVTYYHIELPTHAVILAEGLTVESYLDLGDRADFANSGETVRLFPDFAARFAPDTAMAWETKGAAPLVLAGEQLWAERRRVAERGRGRPGRPVQTASRPA
jgi:T5SS/PEP-CTERM-associated repeat protein